MDAQSGDGLADGQTPIHATDIAVPPLALRGRTTTLEGRCNSPLRNRPGRYCGKHPEPGKTRCRFHGGRSPSGIAHYNFKHGRWSKELQGLPIGEAYERARQHPDLVAHVEHIAVLDARTSELFARLHPMDALPSWGRVEAIDAAFTALREAQRTKDVGTMMASLDAMGIDIGALMSARGVAQNDLEIWAELKSVFHLRKKLVDSESRRRKDAHDMVTSDQFMASMGGLLAIIAEVVTDRQQRQRIVDRVRLLIAGPAK